MLCGRVLGIAQIIPSAPGNDWCREGGCQAPSAGIPQSEMLTLLLFLTSLGAPRGVRVAPLLGRVEADFRVVLGRTSRHEMATCRHS